MAVAKKQEKKKTKSDPFKTRKTKTPAEPAADTITPPEDVAEAIDQFRECQEQARHYEGEATIYKDKVMDYAQKQYVERLQNGINGSFKVLGDETMVTFVVMDSSAGLSEEEVGIIAERWGEAAAEDLITKDYRSIRFDEAVLAAHYEEVVEALQTLPEDILEKLFKPMLMKAKPGAAEKAKKYVKGAEELREILQALKMKNYIK